MKNYLVILIVMLAVTNFVKAQDTNSSDKEEIIASVEEGTNVLSLRTKSNNKFPDDLKALLVNQNNYKLYSFSMENPQSIISKDERIDDLLETDRPVECNVKTVNGEDICTRVTLSFKANIDPIPYLLKIAGLKNVSLNQSDTILVNIKLKDPKPTSGIPDVSLEKAKIVSSLTGSRKEIRIQSKSKVTMNSTVGVKNKRLKISEDNKTVYADDDTITATVLETPTTPSKEFTLELDKKLSEAKTHSLIINDGVFDSANAKVETEGSIEIPGLPKSSTALNFEFKFSAEAADGVKPFFDFKAKYDAKDQIAFNDCKLSINNHPCYWQPQLDIDLGLGRTKSANSIILDLPFRSIISDTNKEIIDKETEMSIPKYEGWKNTPWYRGAVHFFYGPKFEFDRKFQRINMLGSLKLDFRLHRLLGSIADQRSYLLGPSNGLTKEQVSLVEITTGNTFTPYIGIDFGRKVKSETLSIDNTVISETIPKHNVFRTYAGFKNVFETQLFGFPFNLSLDEKLFYLSTEELIGTKGKTAIDIRSVKGFQHRGVFAFDLFFDQVRRYSFNITYENGRKAPNFEYINKVSAGFKVVY